MNIKDRLLNSVFPNTFFCIKFFPLRGNSSH